MCGRPSPARCTKSLDPQARQPARALSAAISAWSFVHTSYDHNVLRRSPAAAPPTSSFTVSVAAIDATRLTAEFNIPEVSQVSTIPRGLSGNIHARHAVLPGTTFNVTP